MAALFNALQPRARCHLVTDAVIISIRRSNMLHNSQTQVTSHY